MREELRLPLVYCFSSSHAQNADGLSRVIRTWLTQLVRLDKSAFEVAWTFSQGRNTRRASTEDVWTLLSKAIVQLQECVLMLDGLDEFQSLDDQRKIFLSRLKRCLQSTTTSALITSRTEFDINSELRPSVPETDKYRILECKISEDTVKEDIDAFASSIVDRRLPGKGDSLRRELSARMAERCQGQFLWLKLQQSQLRDSKTPKILRKSIEVMPQGLHSSYEHSWNSIQTLEEPDRSRTIDTLRWLTFALQPLTVQELTEAMGINPDVVSGGYSEDDVPDDIDDEYIDGEIKQLCGSLVEVQGHDDPRSRLVRLVHASVSDFLSSQLPPPFPEIAPTRSALISAQHSILAACCICFLDSAKTWMPGSGRKDPSFRTYAANTWYRHLSKSGVYHRYVSTSVHRFLKPGNDNFEMWKKEFERNAPSSDLTATSFHYAACFALVPAMVELRDNEHVDINSVGGRFGTALQAACARDDTEAFDQLMQWHADPTIRGGDYGSALNAAAYCGNIHIVQRLLDTAVSPSPLTSELHEAMRLAAGEGCLEVVDLLIDRGAPVDPPDALYPIQRYSMEPESGTSPLLAAAEMNHAKILRLLLERGANPNLPSLPDKTGQTALHVANSCEAVEILLLHGADVNSQMTVGTPLHMASAFGNINTVKALLDNGATIDAHDKARCTPLHDAVKEGGIDVLISLLYRGANPNAQNKKLETPLHMASEYGNTEVVKALLNDNAAIDIHNNWQETPLHYAARAGDINTVAYLLHKGANPNAQNGDLETPLHMASRNDSIEVVKALLDNGAAIDIQDDWQGTPLHDAARAGDIDTVAYLLHKGANPNARDDEFQTPLHLASKEDSIDIVKTMLENGATIDANDESQKTPLHIATKAGKSNVLAYLLRAGANPNPQDKIFRTPLYIASKNGDIDAVKALLDHRATIDTYDEWEQTPLHKAAEAGSIDVLAHLLHKGANPNARNKFGWTPLILAALKGSLNAITTLLEHGTNVNINAQTNKGITPLQIVIGNNTGIARLLIDHGADINLPRKDGGTALRRAITKSDDEFVRHLIQSGADLGRMDHYGMTCSNWLQRARPHLMMPEGEGNEPDKISSGPDTSVLRHHLLDHAKGMRSDEAKTRIWLYFLARCFLLLDMEDHAMEAYNSKSSGVVCDGCDIELGGKVAFFACKLCPKADFCEPCMEEHSEKTRQKGCLSHEYLKIMPLEASNRADYDDEAFTRWLDDIIEQFTD